MKIELTIQNNNQKSSVNGGAFHMSLWGYRTKRVGTLIPIIER